MRLTAIIVAVALFMQNLDSTVIATALPAMARSFHVDPMHMSVALTAYLLSVSMFIPASGWMADRYGSRTIFRAAIVIFTVGSILCGIADNLAFLIAARIIQGAGGAMMVPVGRLVLLRTISKAQMIAATAWLTMPALIGPIMGPPLGGFIVTYVSWRWTFDINVPIGIVGAIAVTLFIPEVSEREAAGRLDISGLVQSGLAMALVMAGCETVGRHIVPLWATAALVGAGLLFGLAYVRHARVHPHPVLDLKLFAIPTFANSVAGASFFRIAIGAMPFLLPLMIQVGFGWSPAESGLITFATAAGALLMKAVAQPTLRRFGFRQTMIVNGALSMLFFVMTAAVRPAWPVSLIILVLLVGGFFRSLQFTAFNTIAYGDVPRARMSAATTLYSTFQQITLTFGITIGALALQVAATLAGHAKASPMDFSVAFIVVSAIGAVSVPLCMRLDPEAGEELSGHHRKVGG